jgi:hypothetical protein
MAASKLEITLTPDMPAIKRFLVDGMASELERLAQQVHDAGALATWTALDVEMLLKGRAGELRAGADSSHEVDELAESPDFPIGGTR